MPIEQLSIEHTLIEHNTIEHMPIINTGYFLIVQLWYVQLYLFSLKLFVQSAYCSILSYVQLFQLLHVSCSKHCMFNSVMFKYIKFSWPFVHLVSCWIVTWWIGFLFSWIVRSKVPVQNGLVQATWKDYFTSKGILLPWHFCSAKWRPDAHWQIINQSINLFSGLGM